MPTSASTAISLTGFIVVSQEDQEIRDSGGCLFSDAEKGKSCCLANKGVFIFKRLRNCQVPPVLLPDLYPK